jgi:energy-coupling factor transporter ATP-binding protein EcfA2
MSEAPAATEPLLRTLAPALRELEKRLRTWLIARRRYPVTTLQRATLEGLASDLDRQAQALQMDRPLLVIMLMGGTGVGKSTLLNALAGGAIAQASFTRPTTRDPVVYYHHSLAPNKLDPALQFCKLVAHDRPALDGKVLVDTPDLDSNDLSNREKLFRLLPVADIVLYVGSQEKYHDKLGWELFLNQRQRRAFAFVLNKWDRCLHPGAEGIRPDEDLTRDLKAEGFEHPLLFRTCAQYWVDHPWQGNGEVTPPVEGEQFLDLARWIELGLTRLEIEAIKARGVSQLLRQLQAALEAVRPPDMSQAVERTRAAWGRLVEDEAAATAAVLLNTLDPYQKEIEHHFARERQRHFSGIMALYLEGFNRMRYAGSTLRDQIPMLPRASTRVETPREWDLAEFARACSAAAAQQHLDARFKALSNRLLVEADTLGLPLQMLGEATESVNRLDWKSRHAQAMIEVISEVEREWSNPTGVRRGVQWLLIVAANWLPLLAFGATGTLLLWDYTMAEPRHSFEWSDLLKPVAVLFITLVLLHIIIALVLPLRWPAIRAEFEERLRQRLQREMEQQYDQVPVDLAREIDAERRDVEQLLGEVREVTSWLEQREQAASIVQLYGR